MRIWVIRTQADQGGRMALSCGPSLLSKNNYSARRDGVPNRPADENSFIWMVPEIRLLPV